MYYLSNRKFKKTVSKINKSLFGGFSVAQCLLYPKNKGKEHFFSLPPFEEFENREKKIKIIKSDYYRMASYKRKDKIKESLAIAIGFSTFQDYKTKTKFRLDIKKLRKIEDADYVFLAQLSNSVLNEVQNQFNFKEKPDFFTLDFVDSIFNNKRSLFLNGKYKNREDFNYLYYFVFNVINFKFEYKDEDIIKSLKSHFDLRMDIDIFCNSDNHLQFFLEDCDEKYLFLKNVYYLNDIFKVEKEINNLNEDDFSTMILNLKGIIRPYAIRAIYLLRKDPNDAYITFLRETPTF